MQCPDFPASVLRRVLRSKADTIIVYEIAPVGHDAQLLQDVASHGVCGLVGLVTRASEQPFGQPPSCQFA